MLEKQEKLRVPYALAVHGQEEEDAVLKVLREHKTIMGEKTKEFEEKIASVFAKKHGIMVNSGSSANLLALQILDLPEGSEVITPALTFSTTLAPIIQCRLKPVFVDVEEGTYVINMKQVRDSITDKTRVLMIPLLIGNVPNLEELRDIAKEHSLIFIEDSCDTLGAQYKNLPSGAYSHISTTSFYGSHVITAGGGGGMISVNNPEWEYKCKILRGWGRSSAVDESESIEKRFGVELEGIPYDSKFIFGDIGYNFLPVEMCSAFGLEQLKKLSLFTHSRNHFFNELYIFFLQYSKYFILPKQLSEVKTNWLAFPLTIKPDAPFTRQQITMHLEENNIQTRPVFTGNVLRQPAFKNATKEQFAHEFPVADMIMRSSFLIGCHQGLTDKHADYMKEVIRGFLDKY